MEARGTRIRRIREEAGYGLNRFARLIGVDPSWLSRIERGQTRKPGPEVLKRIADGLEHPISEIANFGKEDPE